MGSSGLEPPTSRLSGARSNLLSYEPAARCRLRTRTFFSLVGEFSRGPLLWAVLGFHQYWLLFRYSGSLLVLSFLRFSCLSGQGDRSSVSLAWWRWWDSNPWPPACRAGALPTELHPHVGYPSSSFVLLFTMNIWMNRTTHSKLNNNILTPIWFRVGTRISRSP